MTRNSALQRLVLTLMLPAAVGAEPPMAQAPFARSAPQASDATPPAEPAAAQPVQPQDLPDLLRALYPGSEVVGGDDRFVRVRVGERLIAITWGDLPPAYVPRHIERTEPTSAAGWRLPRPGYPFQARKQRLMGTVQVLVRTGPQGAVEQAVLCPGLAPILDEHVLRHVREHWSGPPLAHRTVRLEFRLQD